MGTAVMNDNLLKSQAFKLKGRLYTFTVMHLLSPDRTSIEQQLVDVIAQAPRLFDHTPVVLDCSSIDGDGLDLLSLCHTLREHGLVPVAIQSGGPLLETLAQTQGLAIFHTSSTHDKPITEKVLETVVETIKTKRLTTPVRSGQQVVSKGGDLVIIAPVSHGAELLADGDIHVYGALRGRALAGIAGDKQARIFCQSLEAELVSIAGHYRLSDAIGKIAGPCQIYLQDDRIQIEAL